jgi:hypothetical protein
VFGLSSRSLTPVCTWLTIFDAHSQWRIVGSPRVSISSSEMPVSENALRLEAKWYDAVVISFLPDCFQDATAAVEYNRQRSGNSVCDYVKVLAGSRVLRSELTRWRAGRSEDAATEEPKHRSIARTLFHDRGIYKADSRMSRPTRACRRRDRAGWERTPWRAV